MSVFKLNDYSHRPGLIETEQELRQALKKYRQLSPRFVDMVAPTGDCLTIGISSEYSHVMYTQASGAPPYLYATGDMDGDEDFIEFDAGGTLTPIPISQCIPFDEMIEIAIHFFLTNELPQNMKWDEA